LTTSLQLIRFIQDTRRFLLSFRAIIEQAPLQIYGAALVFSPQKSEIKKQYWQNRLPYIKTITGIRDNWDPCLQALEGHPGPVNAVAFPPDGQTLASASDDGTVRLWDPATGAKKRVLESYAGWVKAVAFSPDGQTLASASNDGTVRLWDPAIGTEKLVLEGHTDWVHAVAFSPDGQTLASASEDGTVRLWDPATGTEKQVFEINVIVDRLSFLNNGKYLKTNRGILSLNIESSDKRDYQNQLSCAMFVGSEWVIQEQQKILWLPPDYRAASTAVYKNTLALGHFSGQVVFFEISRFS
jgi:WD40 repeat protein